MSTHFIDLTGNSYGRLVVIKRDDSTKKYTKWFCLCNCGNTKSIRGDALKSGVTKSCGCLNVTSHQTHKMTKTTEYIAWHSMKSRCYNESYKGFDHYGKRGITVCSRWLNSFENFYADMGEKPTPKHSLDRINNDGGYSPENCKWSTYSEQNRNRRTSVLVDIDGVTKPLKEWCEIHKCNYENVRNFKRKGVSAKSEILRLSKITKP